MKALWRILKKKLSLRLGERAYRKNEWNRAEKLLRRGASQGPGTARIHFMLGNIAFQKGDFETAAIHFRSLSILQPANRAVDGYTIELFQLLAQRLEEWELNFHFYGRAWPRTSNLMPQTLFPGHDMPDLGDFTTLGEYQRFKGLPPISPEEIQTVDTEKLLKALVNKKR
jgi:tetratricopeptide (TPR) repeat protein